MVRLIAFLLLALAAPAFGQSASVLDPCVRAACSNIFGVSVGYPADYTTWGVQYTGAANGACIAAGNAAFGPSCTAANAPHTGNGDVSGKTLVSSALVAGQNTAIMLSVGQSLSSNFSGTSYTATQPGSQNWNLYDRKIYASADPLLTTQIQTSAGLGNGNYLSRLEDKLIVLGKFDRIILAAIADGGTTVADWAPGGKMNARLYNTVAALINQFGRITLIHYGQGEADNAAGTTQAAWQASFAQVVATIRAAGSTAKICVAVETYQSGVASATIRAAQMAVVNGSDIVQCADIDPPVIPNAERQADQTHMNATGADHRATLDAAIINALTLPRRRKPHEKNDHHHRSGAVRRQRRTGRLHPGARCRAEAGLPGGDRRVDRQPG